MQTAVEVGCPQLGLDHAVHVDDHEADYPAELLEEWKRNQIADTAHAAATLAISDEEAMGLAASSNRDQVAAPAVAEVAKAARSLRAIVERSRELPAAIEAEQTQATAAQECSDEGR